MGIMMLYVFTVVDEPVGLLRHLYLCRLFGFLVSVDDVISFV